MGGLHQNFTSLRFSDKDPRSVSCRLSLDLMPFTLENNNRKEAMTFQNSGFSPAIEGVGLGGGLVSLWLKGGEVTCTLFRGEHYVCLAVTCHLHFWMK